MLTSWLSPPSLTWDILSIPDMMLHSPLYLPEPWTGKKSIWKKKTKQKKVSSHPFGLLCLEWRSLHAARRRMKRQMCCSFLCEVITCVVQSGSNFHLVLFKALCCTEPLAVFISETLLVQYLLSSDFDSRLWSVLWRLYVLHSCL